MDATISFAAVEPFSLEADSLTPACCFVDTGELGESFPEPVRSALFATDEWAEAVIGTLQDFLDGQPASGLSAGLRDQLAETIGQLTEEHTGCPCSQYAIDDFVSETNHELERLRGSGVAGWYFENGASGTDTVWPTTTGRRGAGTFDELVGRFPRTVREGSWMACALQWDRERLVVRVCTYGYGVFVASLRALGATQWSLLSRLATEQRYDSTVIVDADGTEHEGAELLLGASPGALRVMGTLVDIGSTDEGTLIELIETMHRRRLLDMSDELAEIVAGLVTNWPLTWDDIFDAALGACLGPVHGHPTCVERAADLVC